MRADRDRAGELVKVLIMVDVWTRMVKTAVVDSKGVVRFSLELNRYECIEYVSDGEPSTKAILKAVRFVRQNLGLSSIITFAQPGDKGCAAIAERSVQTVRRQCSTLALGWLSDQERTHRVAANPAPQGLCCPFNHDQSSP